MLLEFLQALICASEKAANIARACRREPALFSLLVEEKTFQDFKTLADVLIQETVRHDISKKFPLIAENILGEESNTFTNTLGETVTVAVQSTEAQTSELLGKVLNNNNQAAAILASHVHEEISIEKLPANLPQHLPADLLSAEDIGIWIDPIDATSQYIKGGEEEVEEGFPPTRGLKVVTVLIGAFSLSTGQPRVGVVNQPFQAGAASIHWGLNLQDFKLSNVSTREEPGRSKPRVLVGCSEDKSVISKISEHFSVIQARGAGHKLLMVILGWFFLLRGSLRLLTLPAGLCEAYINTAGSTYKWDTCSPHAILAAQGGGLLDLKLHTQILYNVKESGETANAGGIIAFNDRKYCDLLTNIMKIQ